MALRICKECGLEAWSESELELFKKHSSGRYGRDRICKRCHCLIQNRRGEMIEKWPKPLSCYFCGDEVTQLMGKSIECLVIHSLDGNHENWNMENKVPAHHNCHAEYHNPEGERNPRWAENPARSTIYGRKWRDRHRLSKPWRRSIIGEFPRKGKK